MQIGLTIFRLEFLEIDLRSFSCKSKVHICIEVTLNRYGGRYVQTNQPRTAHCDQVKQVHS